MNYFVLNSVLNVLVKPGMCNGQYFCLHIHYLMDMSLFNGIVFVRGPVTVAERFKA
jgi:hypothetical protein